MIRLDAGHSLWMPRLNAPARFVRVLRKERHVVKAIFSSLRNGQITLTEASELVDQLPVDENTSRRVREKCQTIVSRRMKGGAE